MRSWQNGIRLQVHIQQEVGSFFGLVLLEKCSRFACVNG